MPRNSVILIGAGGHCRSCIDVIETTERYTIAGILDIDQMVGHEVSGYKVVGTDNDCAEFVKQGHQFLITIGDLSLLGRRKSIFEKLRNSGATFATVVSPHAYVSPKASIGNGTIIMHKAFVNAFARISENTIINTGSAVEHDASVGNHCHISTYSIVNGGAEIDDLVFTGSASVISNGVKIIAGTIIGAGTVIHKSVNEPGTYVGNPFRKIR